GRAIQISPEEVRPEPLNHTIVVLVAGVHRGVVQALQYARSLRPHHLAAVYVAFEDGDQEAIEKQWNEFSFDVPLEILHSPYRELVDVVMQYLDELDGRWDNDKITVVIPEFIAGRRLFSPTQLLHNQSAAALKLALLFRKGTVVTSVPYHVD
ncbi:MAG: amino acid permease, partial [Actinomycetota bacterium]|nr:amino acid permease [Actinomycetota bacterium]